MNKTGKKNVENFQNKYITLLYTHIVEYSPSDKSGTIKKANKFWLHFVIGIGPCKVVFSISLSKYIILFR